MPITPEAVAKIRERLAQQPTQQVGQPTEDESVPVPYENLPAWQRVLHQLDVKVVEPWAALVTSPFLNSQEEDLLTPEQRELNWYDRARYKYRAWEPGGPGFLGQPLAKFTIEATNPAFWIPYGGVLTRTAGALTKVGGATAKIAGPAAKVLGATGKGITAAEVIPGKLIGGAVKGAVKPLIKEAAKIPGVQAAATKIASKIPKGTRPEFLPSEVETVATKMFGGEHGKVIDISDVNTILHSGTNPTLARRIANMPGLRHAARMIGGENAIANTPAEVYNLGVRVLRSEAKTKAEVGASSLKRFGKSFKEMFGIDESTWTSTSKGIEGLTPEEILSKPKLYESRLNPEQLNAAKAYKEVVEGTTELIESHGIDIKKIQLEEGDLWVSRKHYAMVDKDGNISELAYGGSGGPRRPGMKMASEKRRSFATDREAFEAGFKSIDPFDVAIHNLQSAYNRVIDKEMSDWLYSIVPWRSTTIPEALKLAGELAGKNVKKADTFRRIVTGREVPAGSTMKALERAFPEETELLKAALEIPVRDADAIINNISKEAWQQANISPKRFKEALQQARMGRVAKKPLMDVPAEAAPKPAAAPKQVDLDSALKEFEKSQGIAARTLTEEQYVSNMLKEYSDATKGIGVSLNKTKQTQILKDEYAKKLASGEIISPEVTPKPSAAKSISSVVPPLGGKDITPGELTSTLKILNADTESGMKLLGQIYRQSNKLATAEKKAAMKELRTVSDRLTELTKANNVAVKGQLKKAREIASTRHIGEATVQAPAFQNRFFTGKDAQQIADTITKELNQQSNNALTQLNKVNSLGRFLALAGDASVLTIQVLFLAGSNPRVYAKLPGALIRGIRDKKFLPRYLFDNAAKIAEHPGLLLSSGGATEFTELMAKGGLIRTKPFSYMGRVLEPFQRGFESAIDVAGVEMAKSFDHLATSPAAIAQIDDFINSFRGLQDTGKIGVSMLQRQIETAVLLAPKYNRAIAALLTDVFRGELRGDLARLALGQSVTAIAAMTVAISYAMGDDWDTIVDRLNPSSGRFMTWNIAGQNVGPGTKVRSILMLLAKGLDDPANWPEDLLDFARANSSPVLGTGVDLLTGKDFIGDPTRDSALHLTDTVLIENLLPIWLQSVLTEGGSPMGKLVRGMGEFAGMRTYPMSSYQQYKSLLYDITNGKQMWEISSKERAELENNNPLLAQLKLESREEFDKRGYNPKSTAYYNAKTAASDKRDNMLKAADVAFKTGRLSGPSLRKLIQDTGKELGAKYDQIDSDYADVVAEINTQDTPMLLSDWAMDEYWNIMFNPELEDELGRTDYVERDRRLKELEQRVGPEAWIKVQDMISYSQSKKPDSVRQYYLDMELLQPYWEVEDTVWGRYPPQIQMIAEQISILESTNPQVASQMLKNYPIIVQARSQIASMKKLLRQRDRRVDTAIRLWY
uniref:Large polyvalent protein associated domain-containing protein n=1 Tax=viral metagenome TaxID=1070528 RepID=A0A6H1ZGM1_9ZZZZ